MSLIFGALNSAYQGNLCYPDCSTKQYLDNKICFQHWTKNFIKAPHILSQNINSNHVILADARIYNRKTLFNLLCLDHSQIVNFPDSELILLAYEKWGFNCVNHLIGDFAFAIWDVNLKQLFLARDPLDQRSLFYRRVNNTFYFANLIRPILDIMPSPTFNKLKIGHFSAAITANHDSTFFQDINELPAGNYLIINTKTNEFKIERYWSCHEIIKNPLLFDRREEYLEEFRRLYHEVIADQLALNHSVACLLSGGLDSSSVCSVSAQLFQQENKSLPAFCSIPTPGKFSQPLPNWNYNDRVYMQAVADKYPNIHLHFIQDDHKKLFEHNEILNYWLDQPPLNPAYVLCIFAFIEKALNLNITAIMTSSAGNFTVSWGGPAKKIATPFSLKKILTQYLVRYKQFCQGKRHKQPWRHYSALSKELTREADLLQFYTSHKVEKHADDNRLAIFDAGLRNDSASFYTALRFLYGVDIIDPTADRRIVEFCLRTPYNIFQSEKGSRGLIREGMRGIMPDLICDRSSRGLLAGDWYKKIEQQQKTILQLLQRWKNTDMEDYIDVKTLLKLTKQWNYEKVANSQGKQYINFQRLYLIKLLRGIELGLFIQNYNIELDLK